MATHVRHLMSDDVVTVPAEMPALRAALRMVEKGLRHLVVTDCFGKVVGMLSERNVVKHLSPWLSKLNSHVTVDTSAPRCDVQEIMVERPITVRPDTTLSAAASLLGGNRIGCLPVVDEYTRPVGLLSVVDMLLHMAVDDSKLELGADTRISTNGENHGNRMDVTRVRIGQIMQREVVTVDLDDALSHVRDMCGQHGFHHVIVRDGPRAVGIVSYSDLLKNLSPFVGRKWSEREQDVQTLNRKVHQIMTHQLISATEQMPLRDAAELMVKHGIACLPILGPEEVLRGIVTWKDLIRAAFRIDHPITSNQLPVASSDDGSLGL